MRVPVRVRAACVWGRMCLKKPAKILGSESAGPSREYLFKAWERWCAENRVQPGDGRVFGRNLKAAVPHLGDLRPNQGGERIWAYSGIGLRDDVIAYLGTQWG